MALCSLSTGLIFTPCFRASAITIAPAITRTSLLARATSFPARIAASVGASPALPAVAITTRSTSGCDAISSRVTASGAGRTVRRKASPELGPGSVE